MTELEGISPDTIKFPTVTDTSVNQDMNLSNSYIDILPECILKEGLLQSTGYPIARKHLFSN